MRAVVPVFLVRASDVESADRPVTLTFQIADRGDFAAPPLVERSAQGDSQRFVLDRPLRPGLTIWWRARLHTARGQDVLSEPVGPRTTGSWVRLLQPNSPRGDVVDTRRPRFVWGAAAIPAPPGPWGFVVSVENLTSKRLLQFGPTRDTSIVPSVDLETNTPYRWSVFTASSVGDTITTRNAATFVVVQSGTPTVTLLYQNFPNPFPSTTSATTCIWFDLHRPTSVTLTIHDIRGIRVRTIVPSFTTSGFFLPGRYGRSAIGGTSGCDSRFSWDGRADDGSVAPTGVYLIHLKTDYSSDFKKALFRGF